jgi:CheY-like chemotaxis protein
VGEGTGLGLSVSIGIVEAHGGGIQVDNVPGGGARVTLRLPVRDGIEPGETTDPTRPTGTRGARILLIEDEPSLRSVLIDVLAGMGHAVDEAPTGQAALERLQQASYELIALDLKLPDTDGQSIWRWVRSHRPDLAPRVMFMTGDTMSAETQKFLADAGCPVLNKPLAIAQIARMVNQVLGTS